MNEGTEKAKSIIREWFPGNCNARNRSQLIAEFDKQVAAIDDSDPQPHVKLGHGLWYLLDYPIEDPEWIEFNQLVNAALGWQFPRQLGREEFLETIRNRPED